MPTSSKAPQWYAIYVKSRTEKKVFEALLLQSVEVFLPMQRKLRQWSDRMKWVEVPLIPGYLFVHITRHQYDHVLQHEHVLSYICFGGKAAVIRDHDIDQLKRMLGQSESEVEVTMERLLPGMKVEIVAGPLIGIKGELIEFRGKNRVAIRIEPLNHIFLVDSPENNLVPIGEDQKTKSVT